MTRMGCSFASSAFERTYRVCGSGPSVDHFESALYFAAEIGVARGVDDVDFRILIIDGCVLGENRDAALAFQVVRVHHAIRESFIGAECTGLTQHGIHERGFAMVDVGDDGDVADRSAHGRRFPLLFVNQT